ncbi:MAG TPA: hypothetical protein VJG90_03620 [Candidatus Nanoarchaeia archaeon]|nr:hypothetical protein [Candidatus Nanoarchaeia archaeon]
MKRTWQLFETYIWAGSYPLLWLLVEKNKKKMLNEMEEGKE